MEQKRNKKRNKLGEAEKSWILLGIAFSFMMCVFAPLETFLPNQSEFWFRLSQVIPSVLLAFIGVNILFILIFFVIRKRKFFVYIYAFFFCALVYFYLQGNYVPRNYGVLDGKEIAWSSYTGYAIASLVLMGLAVIAWIIVCLKVKEKLYGIGQFVCVVLILLQIVTIGTVFIQHNVMDKSETNNVVVTTDGCFELSEDNNVLVFILDTFDSYVMKDLLAGEDGEKYRELFADFTYYPDTVGAYPTTKCALPQILTGQWYENDIPYSEYITNAYAGTETYNILRENGYSIGVYTSSMFLSPDPEMYVNVEYGDYVVNNYLTFTEKLYGLVAFNYMPHQVKKHFYTTSADFDSVKASSVGDAVFTDDVQNFYSDLQGKGLSVTNEQKSFRIYHLAGIHNPFTFGGDLESVDGVKYDVYDEASGNFTLLELYFNMMREQGIYDNSTIIIMADHGSTGFSQNPLFMIKNVSEKHEFQISDAQMSYSYLHDIFGKLATGEVVNDSDIQELAEKGGTRRFLYYAWDDGWQQNYLPTMTEYNVTGNATQHGDFVATGRTFFAGDADNTYEYTLGTELSFGGEHTGNAYCLSGFYNGEQKYTWTAGKAAEMQFKVEDEFDALEISMAYSIYKDHQRIKVYVDDTLVDEFYAKKDEERTIIVPGDAVKGTEFKVRFELPDAESPKDRGEGTDTRVLGLALKTFTMSEIDMERYNALQEEKQNEYLYELDSELSFKSEKTAEKYCLYGFYDGEAGHTWAGAAFEMRFKIEEEYDILAITTEYTLAKDQQWVKVYVDDTLVEEYLSQKNEEHIIYVQKDVVQGEEFDLRFELPWAKSPRESGEGDDPRVLGAAMKTLSISAIDEDRYNEMLEEAENRYKYELGKELNFGEKDTKRYFQYGFYDPEKTYTWIGTAAAMQFKLDDDFDALAITLGYSVDMSYQRVKVYVNDVLVDDFIAKKDEEKTILVSAEDVRGSEFTLRFECPDAKSHAERGVGYDVRVLGLAMKSLVISEIDAEQYNELLEEQQQEYRYELGTKLLFSEEATQKYCLYGFYDREEGHAWMSSDAGMKFTVGEADDLEIAIEYATYMGARDVLVYVNDTLIEQYVAEKDEEKKILVPKAVVNGQEVVLRIECPDAKSQKEQGDGEDLRVLGLAMKSITISAVNE